MRIAVAVLIGIVCLSVGLFGLWGLSVLFEQWSYCYGGGLGGSTSYPPDFCERTNWVRQWGIGIGLAAIGIVGGVLAIRLARWQPRPKPPADGREAQP